jgi:O-antigen/teichoic acid export membrane protein
VTSPESGSIKEFRVQLRGRQIARNIVFNWAGNIIGMAVGFFLAPFILHRLGNVAYGVWVLAVSAVGYLGLLDLGLQSSLLRFVSQGYAKQDHHAASEATSAALWVRFQISALALVLSAALAAVFPHVFNISPALAKDAQESILLIGLTASVSLPFGVVGAVISALNRYDLQNYVGMFQTAVRVIGVILVLRTGHGIVAIAVCELVAALSGKLLQTWIARRLYPELHIQLKKPKLETLKKIWSYSVYTFLITIAVQLVYQTDNLVVGKFVSTTAVTFYAIANQLCRYASQVLSSMSGTFMPAASTFEAAGDTEGLFNLYKNGTRIMIIVSLPIVLTFITRGSSFIGLWMGPQYSHSSGIVLIILTVALFFSFANQTAAAIAMGVEKHKTMAWWAIGEGAANLVLSILLVHWYGIYGVAIGTLIPSLVAQLGFWPYYTSKLLGLTPVEIVWNVWGPAIAAGIPFAIFSYTLESFFPAHKLAVFAFQVAASLSIYLLTVALVFRSLIRSQVVPRVRALFVAHAK